MKLFIFIFALVLLQVLAKPIEDEPVEINRAQVREVAVKAAKFKKAFTEFHDVLVQHPQILDGLSKAIPPPAKTMKSLGSQQKEKRVNKKFFGLIESVINWIG